MLFYNPPADCQADSSAGILIVVVQALKDFENLGSVWGGNADAVVAHFKDPFAIGLVSRHVDLRRFLATVLQRIADNV